MENGQLILPSQIELKLMPDSNKGGYLSRRLGLLDAVGIGLGAVIGAGIFVVTGVAAGVAGPAFLLGLVIAGFAATCNGLSSAQLAAQYPKSGGTYEYGNQVLNSHWGFAAGWMFLLSKLSAGGVVSIGFGNYFALLVPGVHPKVAALGAVMLLMVANYLGVKKAGRLNLVIVGITLLALLYFIASGISSIEMSNLVPFAPTGLGGIMEASAMLFFAFTGYARIATLGEEVKAPQKTIPGAIIITLITSVVLYLAVGFVAVGGVGANVLGSVASPLGYAAQVFQAPGLFALINLGASTAMLGVLLSQILGISRVMLAMSRRGDLPAALSTVHLIYKVPHYGILVCGGIIMMLSLFGTLEFIVSAASFSILLYYSITNIAAFKLQKQFKRYSDLVPILGLFACLSMAMFIEYAAILYGLAILGGGFVFRFVRKTVPTKK